MKIKKIEKLAVGVVFFSWLAWWPVYYAFWGDGKNSWFPAIILFILNFSIWCLFVILEKNVNKNLIVLTLASIPIFWMFKDNFGLMILGLVFFNLFFLLGIKAIREEFEGRVEVKIFRSLRFGFKFLIIGFSIVFSLGVFSLLKNEQIFKISTPKIEIDKKSAGSILETSGNFVTDKKVKEDLVILQRDVTLLEFVEKSNFFKKEAPLVKADNEFKTIFLEKLAAQLDFEVLTGEEKTLSLISQFLNKKINGFFGFLEEKKGNDVSAWVGAITIFFVIISLGWSLGFLVKGLSALCFFGLRKSGWLRVEEIEEKMDKIRLDF